LAKFKLFQNRIDKWTIFWAWVGKIGILIPIILGLIEFGKYIFVKEYEVTAIGRFKFYEIPDSLFMNFAPFIQKIDSIDINSKDSLQKNIKLKYQTESFITNLLSDMSKFDYNIPSLVGENISQLYALLYPLEDTTRVDKFSHTIDASKIKEITGTLQANLFHSTYICKISIENEGSKELNNVFLNLKSTKGFYRIKEIEEIKGREGYTDQISNFLESIEIGKVEPKEARDVTIWIERPIKKEQFRLTHSGILVDIDFEEFEIP